MATYTIFTKDLEATTKKINRITKKCQKANVPFIFNVGESYDKVIEIKNANGDASHYIISLTDIEVDCQFKHDGWTALGLVQRKDGIVQCYFDNASLIKEYSKTDFHCDHCKKHVHRNSVVILEHENGERKVVGTSCVEEFTCGLSGNLVAAFADLSFELENDCERIAKILEAQRCSDGDDVFDIDAEWSREMNELLGINGVPCYDVDKIVACAANIISCNGFKSSQDDEATWKFIPDCYDHYNQFVSENDKLEAKKAIDWILGMSEDERTQSSYIFNIYQICASGYCTMRHFGLLASLIPSYKKSEFKRIQSETKSISNYVGNVGDKFNLTLTYIKTISYETQYGVGHFHFFRDEQGNIFKWSTNSIMNYIVEQTNGCTPIYSLDIGATVKVSGRIKAHDEYRGEKQTVITRCKYEVLESRERDMRLKELESVEFVDQVQSDKDLEEIFGLWEA